MFRPQPIFYVGKYEAHPLTVVSEATFTELFLSTCQRGNPLLQGRPREELAMLGSRMYRKGLSKPLDIVLTAAGGTQLVAFSITCDMGDSSLWQDADMPPSLRLHAAVAAEVKANMPSSARASYGVLAGVLPGHPGTLLSPVLLFGMLVHALLGYDHRFAFFIHPAVLAAVGTMKHGYMLDETYEVPLVDSGLAPEFRHALEQLNISKAAIAVTNLRPMRDSFEEHAKQVSPQLGALMLELRNAAQHYVASFVDEDTVFTARSRL